MAGRFRRRRPARLPKWYGGPAARTRRNRPAVSAPEACPTPADRARTSHPVTADVRQPLYGAAEVKGKIRCFSWFCSVLLFDPASTPLTAACVRRRGVGALGNRLAAATVPSLAEASRLPRAGGAAAHGPFQARWQDRAEASPTSRRQGTRPVRSHRALLPNDRRGTRLGAQIAARNLVFGRP